MIRLFHGWSWQECDGVVLPEDSSLLVSSIGTENVRAVEEGICLYKELKGIHVPYIMVAEQKDDVNFYVPKENLQDLTDFLKPFLKERKTIF